MEEPDNAPDPQPSTLNVLGHTGSRVPFSPQNDMIGSSDTVHCFHSLIAILGSENLTKTFDAGRREEYLDRLAFR